MKLRTALTLASTAGLALAIGCKDMKDDDTTSAGTKPITAPAGGEPKIVDTVPVKPGETKATIPAADDTNPGPIFARTELRPIEASNSPKLTGNVELYGTASKATMKLWVTNLTAGTYGVFLGKDCRPASAMRDNNPADSKGVGSATIRKDELRLGSIVVGEKGEGELTAAVPYNYADAPPLTDMSIILMPASAEKMDEPQTKVACGDIDGVPSGS
jgi:hypothetical protein